MCKRGLVTAGLCCCVSMFGWAQHTEAAPNKARGGTERVLTRGTPQAADAANKVTICHKAGPVKFFELSVAGSAVPGHLRHGDCVVDDGVSCTVDSCDADLGCVHVPDDSRCDNGVFCDGIESCTPTGCAAVSACPPAIDLENCLVYGRCVEDSDDHCPGDPLPDCCGNGIVEDGEECESHADCPVGFFCDACTCTEEPSPECDGATCTTFLPCNPGSGCVEPVCATTDLGGVCLEGTTLCAALLDCTTSDDCPDLGVCAVDTCCGRNVCIPTSAFCLDNATAVVPTAPVKTTGSTISQRAN